MSNTQSDLQAVLDDVIGSAGNLRQQIAGQEQQIAMGKVQLARFDALIAALQVSVTDQQTLAAVDAQVGANALLSPTRPAAAVDTAVAGIAPEAANEAAAVSAGGDLESSAGVGA